jgi:hypothetical protein
LTIDGQNEEDFHRWLGRTVGYIYFCGGEFDIGGEVNSPMAIQNPASEIGNLTSEHEWNVWVGVVALAAVHERVCGRCAV